MNHDFYILVNPGHLGNLCAIYECFMQKRFLLHICCGPCVIAILEELKRNFEVTAYYYNPNIHPKEEYEKRKAEVIKICEEMAVPFIEGGYNPVDWFKLADEYKDEPEGGERCRRCFAMRLEETAKYAVANGFDYFSCTLTSGRNKKADIINPLGVEVGRKYGVKFYEENWKKRGRQDASRILCQERGVYRQHYCGCVYSKLV